MRAQAAADEKAYGGAEKAYIPKFHFTRHPLAQLATDGWLIDTYVAERKHASLKEAADPVRNIDFEKSVLARALVLHKSKLVTLRRDGLLELALCPELGGSISLCVQWRGTILGVGDVLFLDDDLPFIVSGCACVGDTFYILGHNCALLEQVTSKARRWRHSEAHELKPLIGHARLAAMWTHESGRRFLTIET